MRDPRYDILFEPVRLGPVTAKNRFYQVPHCTGMGWQRPKSLAAMRGIKAEGGWGVVCTEYCSVHPTSDDGAFPYTRLWDSEDVAAHAMMTERVHEQGALAGVELWLGGSYVANLDTRLPPIGLRSRPFYPIRTTAIRCRAGVWTERIYRIFGVGRRRRRGARSRPDSISFMSMRRTAI